MQFRYNIICVLIVMHFLQIYYFIKDTIRMSVCVHFLFKYTVQQKISLKTTALIDFGTLETLQKSKFTLETLQKLKITLEGFSCSKVAL